MSVKVVIADDQALVRGGFRMILDAKEDMEVAGEAADGAEAIALVEEHRPDVVLMDVRMPNVDGIEATRQIVADATTSARVVILTTFERDEYVFGALAAGASGFMLKNAPPETLIRAVRVIAAGDALLAPSVTRRLIEDFARTQPRRDTRDLDRLTDRERDVLVWLATGKSNAELAEALGVGEGTIKTHVSSVLSKLGVRDRVQAVVYAYESGLVRPST